MVAESEVDVSELSPDVYDIAELPPVEDPMLGLLRPRLGAAGVRVLSAIPPDMADAFPFVLVRRQYNQMHARGDARSFTDQAYIQVDVFTEGVNGDEDGATLSDAVRVILRDAWLNQTVEPVTKAALSSFRVIHSPRRAGDWANATGPVQYADLPAGAWRYTTTYRLTFRYPQ